jgi:hypothetical protein
MTQPGNELTSIFELGVEEAYVLLRDTFGVTDLAPLEAIENEDWGRDSLLRRLWELSDAQLAQAGLTRESSPPSDPHGSSHR